MSFETWYGPQLIVLFSSQGTYGCQHWNVARNNTAPECHGMTVSNGFEIVCVSAYSVRSLCAHVVTLSRDNTDGSVNVTNMFGVEQYWN